MKWLPAVLLAVAFAVCYGEVLTQLASGWWEVKAYSHGFLVIPISLYLVWENKRALQRLSFRPDYVFGILTIFLAGGMLVVGRLGEMNILEAISLIVMVPGWILFFLGRAYLKALAFPICYLVFMLPFFDLIGEGIYWPLQIFSARMASELLNLFGYAAYLEGKYIQLPKVTLDVAKACAGIQYLISILAIGMPLAYLSLQGWWRRVALVGSAILIAIVANGLRVMLVGVIVYDGDLTYSHGPFHILQGVFVAWMGFIVLFVGSWWLSRSEVVARLSPDNTILPFENQKTSRYSYLTVIGIFLFMGAMLHFYTPNAVPFNEAIFSSLQKVGDWEGTTDDLKRALFRMPEVDTEKGMLYSDAKGVPLRLYVGYFASQQQGKELVGYATDILFENAVEIPIGAFRVNKTIIRDGQTNHLVLFWYDLGGRVLANRYATKGWGLWNMFRLKQNNGVIMMVSTPLSGFHDETDILKREIHFVETLLPMLRVGI